MHFPNVYNLVLIHNSFSYLTGIFTPQKYLRKIHASLWNRDIQFFFLFSATCRKLKLQGRQMPTESFPHSEKVLPVQSDLCLDFPVCRDNQWFLMLPCPAHNWVEIEPGQHNSSYFSLLSGYLYGISVGKRHPIYPRPTVVWTHQTVPGFFQIQLNTGKGPATIEISTVTCKEVFCSEPNSGKIVRQ